MKKSLLLLLSIGLFSNICGANILSGQERIKAMSDTCNGIALGTSNVDVRIVEYMMGYTKGVITHGKIKHLYKKQPYYDTLKDICKMAIDMDYIMPEEEKNFDLAFSLAFDELIIQK